MKILVILTSIGLLISSFLIYIPVRAEDKLIIINEFLPDGIGSDAGKEWVELFNVSANDINLDGWKISTKTTTTPRVVTLTNTTIKANSYLIISEFDIDTLDFKNVGSGKLNMYNSNAEIFLSDNNGEVIDSLIYGATQEGKSLERRGPVDSEYCNLLQISNGTLGFENSSKDLKCWSDIYDPISAPNPNENPDDTAGEDFDDPGIPDSELGAQSSIVISEAYASPNSSETEWLEVYNQDILKVELTGMYFKERAGEGLSSTKTFLPGITLNPGGYLLINQLDLSLNNNGDTIYLLDVNDTIVDNFKYGSIESSNSASRKILNNVYQKIYNTNPDLNLVPASSIPTPGSVNLFPEYKTVKISDLKSYQTNTLVKTIGIINSKVGLVTKSAFYIQDGDAGVKIQLNFDPGLETFEIGDRIEVSGKIQFDANNQVVIEVEDLSRVRTFSKNNKYQIMDINEIKQDLNLYIGTICYFAGEISQNHSTTFYLSSGENIIKIKILNSSGIGTISKSIRDMVEVKGVFIKDGDYFTIIPGYSSDIKVFSEDETSEKTESRKKINPSTLSFEILGESEILDQNFKSDENLNIGDNLYSSNSPTENQNKIYPWPLYLTTGSVAFLEVVKTLVKAFRYL